MPQTDFESIRTIYVRGAGGERGSDYGLQSVVATTNQAYRRFPTFRSFFFHAVLCGVDFFKIQSRPLPQSKIRFSLLRASFTQLYAELKSVQTCSRRYVDFSNSGTKVITCAESPCANSVLASLARDMGKSTADAFFAKFCVPQAVRWKQWVISDFGYYHHNPR